MNHQNPSNGDENRRKDGRRREHRHIWVDRGGTSPAIDCKVIDVCKGGARIAPPLDVALPNTITMQFDASDLKRKAHVVWRNAHEIGVAFAERQAASDDGTAAHRERSTALMFRTGNSPADMVAATRIILQAHARNLQSSRSAAAGLVGWISQEVAKFRTRLDGGTIQNAPSGTETDSEGFKEGQDANRNGMPKAANPHLA